MNRGSPYCRSSTQSEWADQSPGLVVVGTTEDWAWRRKGSRGRSWSCSLLPLPSVPRAATPKAAKDPFPFLTLVFARALEAPLAARCLAVTSTALDMEQFISSTTTARSSIRRVQPVPQPALAQRPAPALASHCKPETPKPTWLHGREGRELVRRKQTQQKATAATDADAAARRNALGKALAIQRGRHVSLVAWEPCQVAGPST
ncbi:hypothetical protein F5884DRAFT_291341 [Xylogone sp. PMI_703]|nr:hypothetical protein F5884DRAFT_291341 [Xylogone sp. PMI_703]